jgi:hypothetical protein
MPTSGRGLRRAKVAGVEGKDRTVVPSVRVLPELRATMRLARARFRMAAKLRARRSKNDNAG